MLCWFGVTFFFSWRRGGGGGLVLKLSPTISQISLKCLDWILDLWQRQLGERCALFASFPRATRPLRGPLRRRVCSRVNTESLLIISNGFVILASRTPRFFKVVLLSLGLSNSWTLPWWRHSTPADPASSLMTPAGEGVGVRSSVLGGFSMRDLLAENVQGYSWKSPSTVVLVCVCPLNSVTYNPSLSRCPGWMSVSRQKAREWLNNLVNDILEMIFGFLQGWLPRRVFTEADWVCLDIAGCFWGKPVAVKCSDIDRIILGSPQTNSWVTLDNSAVEWIYDVKFFFKMMHSEWFKHHEQCRQLHLYA